jgi:microcystin-dependent protein
VSTPFLGEIRMFGFNFAPIGWAFCQGQLLPISQNPALFALIGTFYGGNGSSNFALPDLRSRVPLSMGQGTGLSNYNIGQAGGTETVTLSVTQMPSHNHPVNASDSRDFSLLGPSDRADSPAGHVLARGDIYAGAPDGATVMNAGMIGDTGAADPVGIIQPYLSLNFCIALTGIFPSRS